MTVHDILQIVRRVELRTMRLANDTMVGAYSSRFKERGQFTPEFKPLEFEGVSNCGEFATIKADASKPNPVLIPSSSTGLKTSASVVSRN
jgi:hypothetical protein